jgi:hypothetical protein
MFPLNVLHQARLAVEYPSMLYEVAMLSAELANGDELCLAIEEIAEVEWRKFQSRTVSLAPRSGEVYHRDNSKFTPFTSIRFKQEDQELVEKMTFTIAMYRGKVEWQMIGHPRISLPGTNWVIRPSLVDQIAAKLSDGTDLNVRDYIANHYPDFALVAYADLLGLVKHVREALQKYLSRRST